MADQGTQKSSGSENWMGDVQRALVIMLVGTLCFCIIAVTLRVVLSGDLPTLTDMAKTLQAALVNMGLIGLGYFFGNTIAKMQQDRSSQQLTDKLTSVSPPTSPPPTAWWSKLTDAEKNAITVDDDTDARTKAIATAMISAAATADDLAYLVSKGLLTKERAAEIAAA